GRHAALGTNRDWWPSTQLRNVQFLGRTRVNTDELEMARLVLAGAPGTYFTAPAGANYAAEGEWRWAHDRESYVAETEEQREKAEQARAAQELRYRERLSKLTYDQLLAETPLARWTGASPYPPDDFTSATRSKLHEAARAL